MLVGFRGFYGMKCVSNCVANNDVNIEMSLPLVVRIDKIYSLSIGNELIEI